MKKTAILLGIIALWGTSLGYAQTVTYEESFENFPNPERGFYRPLAAGFSSNFTPLSASELISNRTTLYTPFSANYRIRNTLVYRYYVLDNFKNSNISSAYLDNIRNDLATIREAGVKIIMRFAYDITAESGDCPDSTACPPYGDAPKQSILNHIAQLGPVFSEYYDVIAVVQMGFIGIWGEQYYTDFFGDTSPNSAQDRLFDNNWQDRLEVLNALLDAVPESRMVQVRYPQIKQKAIYGIDAPVTSAPLSAAQAYNGSDIARLGFHNDCFLSGPDDFGTYFDYGTSSSPATSATDALKSYFAQDSRYVAVGGETCSNGFSPQNDCSGIAVSEMRSLHYSYLNSEFNNEVNNDWQTGGCMDEIQRNLGYRLVMEQGTYAAEAEPGSPFNFSLAITNVGFAAPYNPRLIELVLRHTESGEVYKIPLTGNESDVRFWLPGENITLGQSLTLPADVPAGEYALLLNIPDTSNNNVIAARPEYAIRLANENTWEAATGYNNLNHTLTVGSGGNQVSDVIGEVGQVTASQSVDQWRTVSLEDTYADPVVVMGPVSFNGGQPTTVRVRNVTTGSFEYQIDEWNYLDGNHTTETISYLVVEAGTHDLGNGNRLIAGTQSVGTGFATVDYEGLGQTPIVLTQVTTVNEADAVITRAQNVGATRFQVRLQEEEGAADGGSHANETVAWIALSSGSGDAGRAYEAVRTASEYQQDFRSLTFGASYPEPVLLAALQSYNGSDPAGLRYRDLSATSVSVKVEEETSGDSETGHVNEVVGALVFAGSGPITAASDDSPGPTTIVVDGADEDWSNVAELTTATGPTASLKAYHDADNLYLLVTGSPGVNNQFYLDADNSGTTGYNNAALWSNMGADYLIENGTLFTYTGDGSSFAWSPVVGNGGLTLTKTSEVIELSVPRGTLTGLGTVLRIGYSDLDDTFTPVAQLPTSGDIARYPLGVINARFATADKSPHRKLPADEALTVYPNPGHDWVTVTYRSAQAGLVRLEIYSLTGQLEQILISEEEATGSRSVQFDAQALGNGVHVIRLRANGQVITRKLVVQ